MTTPSLRDYHATEAKLPDRCFVIDTDVLLRARFMMKRLSR